jgi:ribonuclease Z
MDFQFLGTGSGTPSRARNVSALALRAEGSRRWSLVHCGEGTQHRILRTPLSLHDLDAVFITHMHGDHCYGLPGLLASAGMLNRSRPLTLVGPPALRAFLDGVMASTELGLPYRLDVAGVDDAPDLALPDFAVHATPLSHRIPSWAYTFVERAVEAQLDTDALRAAGVPPSEVWGRIQRRQDVELPDGRQLRAATFCKRRAPRAAPSWPATTTIPACCLARCGRPTCWSTKPPTPRPCWTRSARGRNTVRRAWWRAPRPTPACRTSY